MDSERKFVTRLPRRPSTHVRNTLGREGLTLGVDGATRRAGRLINLVKIPQLGQCSVFLNCLERNTQIVDLKTKCSIE